MQWTLNILKTLRGIVKTPAPGSHAFDGPAGDKENFRAASQKPQRYVT
jgi:hypothetical protein